MNASRARIAQGMQRRHEQLGQPKGRTAGRIALRGNCMRKTVEKSPRIISRGKYIQYRGRVEIGGVYLSSQLECTPQLCT